MLSKHRLQKYGTLHTIEPYYSWRTHYIASQDKNSPFYGRTYSEFSFSQTVYNYYIHPQWDEFGSETLYTKVLYADYELGYVIMEFLGEWNDAINNDVMYLKREVIDPMIEKGICRFILICENVLNFHGSDNCYYEEWFEDVTDEEGWIVFLNLLDHVEEEMADTQIQYYSFFGEHFNDVLWRKFKPQAIMKTIQSIIWANNLLG